MKKKVLLGVLVIVTMFSVISTIDEKSIIENVCILNEETNIINDVNFELDSIEDSKEEIGSYHYYDMLSEEEKLLYDAIVIICETKDYYFDEVPGIGNWDSDKCIKIYDDVLKDHPEFFYMAGRFERKQAFWRFRSRIAGRAFL